MVGILHCSFPLLYVHHRLPIVLQISHPNSAGKHLCKRAVSHRSRPGKRGCKTRAVPHGSQTIKLCAGYIHTYHTDPTRYSEGGAAHTAPTRAHMYVCMCKKSCVVQIYLTQRTFRHRASTVCTHIFHGMSWYGVPGTYRVD